MGTQPPPHKGVEPPLSNFRPISIVAMQTAGCIKMTLGMEVGLSPDDFVLDGDPAPLPKRRWSPNFQPMSILAKWLDASAEEAYATLCSMWTQLSPEKGTHTPTQFWPMAIVAKWLDG